MSPRKSWFSKTRQSNHRSLVVPSKQTAGHARAVQKPSHRSWLRLSRLLQIRLPHIENQLIMRVRTDGPDITTTEHHRIKRLGPRQDHGHCFLAKHAPRGRTALDPQRLEYRLATGCGLSAPAHFPRAGARLPWRQRQSAMVHRFRAGWGPR